MNSSAEKFWSAVERWDKLKPHLGIEFRSPSEFFAFKGIVTKFSLGESVTFRNLDSGKERLLDLELAEFRFVEFPEPNPSGTASVVEEAVSVFIRIMWPDNDDSVCTLTEMELRVSPKPPEEDKQASQSN